ncbi:unnamed protein product [Urochloa decumbens]|uniref:F-box domain-containing protein n=1 Tax=Urochloa decumbens TaxID=240449 RepID=A0ABC8WZ39_9POAL
MEQHEAEPSPSPSPARRLPSDVLADVLRHLPPRGLAASRCACTDWRAAVDDRGLLRAAVDALLPRSLDALLVNYPGFLHTEFFSRPAAPPGRPHISGELSTYLPAPGGEYRDSYTVRDHCNGLLLLDGHVVVNPATRRCAPLPAPPPLDDDDARRRSRCLFHEYLVYDPAVSLHYEVFVIPRISWSSAHAPMSLCDRPADDGDRGFLPGCDARIENIAWPPSPFNISVFSSRTGQWERRSFVREGPALGSVADMLPSIRILAGDLPAVYWRRELYVQDQTNFVMRITLASDKYQMIKPPLVTGCTNPRLRLAGSEKGVYYVLHDATDPRRLRVWILDESCGQMEWVLKYDHDLSPVLELWNRNGKLDGPWVLQDINYYYDEEQERKEEDMEEAVDLKLEWDSDNDDFLEEGTETDSDGSDDDICYIGFHPYKEVVFFSRSMECKGLAYHLSSSKVQNLGNLCPKSHYVTCYCVGTALCFTPCWLEELPGSS